MWLALRCAWLWFYGIGKRPFMVSTSNSSRIDPNMIGLLVIFLRQVGCLAQCVRRKKRLVTIARILTASLPARADDLAPGDYRFDLEIGGRKT